MIVANFMTLELYYYTELGAVIDTRCIAIYIAQYGFSLSQYIAIRFLAYRCTPNNKHYLLIGVAPNDREINVIDHAKVVKTFRDLLSSLCDYLSVINQNSRTNFD